MKTWGTRDLRKNINCPDHSAAEISQNTKKCLEELKKLAITYFDEDHQLLLI